MRTKKVFVVKHFNSPYIEEAIFILRENIPADAVLPDAVSEAERIVTGYLESMDCPRPPGKRRGGKFLLGLLGVISLVGLLFLLF